MKTARQWFRMVRRSHNEPQIIPMRFTRQQATRDAKDARFYKRCDALSPEPDEFYDDDFGCEDEWCDTCQNMGVIDCHCGGDLCVCYNFGEMPCPNCGYL